MKKQTSKLSHYDNGFKKVKKYHDIWDDIMYKKISEIEYLAEKVINVFEKHIDSKLLIHKDYNELQSLFRRMRIKKMFYMSGDASDIIEAIDPKLKNLYKKKKCFRSLKYIGQNNQFFTHGKVYQSKTFNGVTYKIIEDDNGKEIKTNCGQFERIS